MRVDSLLLRGSAHVKCAIGSHSRSHQMPVRDSFRTSDCLFDEVSERSCAISRSNNAVRRPRPPASNATHRSGGRRLSMLLFSIFPPPLIKNEHLPQRVSTKASVHIRVRPRKPDFQCVGWAMYPALGRHLGAVSYC